MAPKAKTLADTVDPETETVENGSGPIVVNSTGTVRDRVLLFTIDDEEFDVPQKPGVNVTLKFLNTMRKTGNEMFAAMGLLESMLGEAKFNTLLDYDELSDELLGQILEQVVKLAMERVDEPSGK